MRSGIRRIGPESALAVLAACGLCGCQQPRSNEVSWSGDPAIASTNPSANERGDRLSVRWIIRSPRSNERAPIRFRFPPPEDGYGGEVSKCSGFLEAGEEVAGVFEVQVVDISMGEPDLDANVRFNLELLNGRQFPAIRYRIESVSAAPGSAQLRPSPVTLRGVFELKGVSVPLEVAATIERVENQPPELVLRSSFSLEQLRERFNIAGPGGEHGEAGNRLNFDVELHLVPEEQSAAP